MLPFKVTAGRLREHTCYHDLRPELERNLIVERVRAGMRRARLEGRHIGRHPLQLDRDAILCDHRRGLSLRQIANAHRISRTTVHRVLHDHPSTASSDPVPKGL